MHRHLTSEAPRLLANAGGGEGGGDDGGAGIGGPLGAVLFGDGGEGEPVPAVLEAQLWGCRTCGACQRECPMYIEHVPKIVDMRRHLVMTESKMGEDAQAFLKNMDDRMHPFVGESRDREAWFEDLDVKVFGNGDEAEYLFWVGCAGSMLDRNIDVSRAMVKVLDAAGVDFALLGGEEVCTGDPARRVGGELTYQICAKENIENFERYGVKKIITTCPHCFNTLKNEYPDFGGSYEVVHHSELISELIHDGKLQPKKSLDAVTYHDPCYLGRHNEVYEPPRDVVSSVTEPGGYIELEKSRSRSDCCGAGGGYAWMDDAPEKRINHSRFEQVKGCGAKTTAVSCPFCMQMFDDAGGALDPDQKMRTADIAELVAEALDDE
jgi:Fe-S oxidoreductase